MIFVVEDDPNIRELVTYTLQSTGFDACGFENGSEFLKALSDGEKPELVLLDIMLPGEDGISILGKLRKKSATRDLPIIMMTAKGTEYDKVLGLDSGADDYITKPFSLAVLRARVNAQLRRSVPVKQERIELNGFILDFTRMEFSKEGTIIDLSKTEQRLLRLLVENRGRTLPRELLLEKVWDGGEFVDENALSVAVRRLRGKLGNAPIRTVYGVGYTWEVSK